NNNNNGTSHYEATNSRLDSNSWEAPDSVKGGIARMIFYVFVRYEGKNNDPDLELNDNVINNLMPFIGILVKVPKRSCCKAFKEHIILSSGCIFCVIFN
ncbi:TPA: endonuclease, partial [Bacillus anthracis]|nr:endonuclease [Bacillus anthracis]